VIGLREQVNYVGRRSLSLRGRNGAASALVCLRAAYNGEANDLGECEGPLELDGSVAQLNASRAVNLCRLELSALDNGAGARDSADAPLVRGVEQRRSEYEHVTEGEPEAALGHVLGGSSAGCRPA
jgi:hypothetical protein